MFSTSTERNPQQVPHTSHARVLCRAPIIGPTYSYTSIVRLECNTPSFCTGDDMGCHHNAFHTNSFVVAADMSVPDGFNLDKMTKRSGGYLEIEKQVCCYMNQPTWPSASSCRLRDQTLFTGCLRPSVPWPQRCLVTSFQCVPGKSAHNIHQGQCTGAGPTDFSICCYRVDGVLTSTQGNSESPMSLRRVSQGLLNHVNCLDTFPATRYSDFGSKWKYSRELPPKCVTVRPAAIRLFQYRPRPQFTPPN